MKRKPVSIKEVLPDLYSKLEKKESELENILRAWKDAVDDKTYKRTRPLRIKKGTLQIIVQNSAWIFDLSLKKESLLSELNKSLGNQLIKDLKFKVGSI